MISKRPRNSSVGTSNNATSNNMKLVHQPLMGAVTFDTARRGLGRAAARPDHSSLYQM